MGKVNSTPGGLLWKLRYLSFQRRKFPWRDEMIFRSSYVQNGISYTAKWPLDINSLQPSAAYMRQWIGSALVQINGLSPIRCQTIILTNAGLLSIGPLGTNFSEILIKIQNFSFTKMHLKITSVKWRPFRPGGDELKQPTGAQVMVARIQDLMSYHTKDLAMYQTCIEMFISLPNFAKKQKTKKLPNFAGPSSSMLPRRLPNCPSIGKL